MATPRLTPADRSIWLSVAPAAHNCASWSSRLITGLETKRRNTIDAELLAAERPKRLGLVLHRGADLTQPIGILLKDSDGGGDPVPKDGVIPLSQYSPRDLDECRVRRGVQF